MEAFRHSLLPRRLTQMYADTKKSYEHVVRTNQIRGSSQSSPTDRKLRIQKDRLIAWGLEWADSSASHAGDIDDSLDRAGISDLVESIMTSINELLDEADRLQSSHSFSLPGSFPDDKSVVRAEIRQSDRDAARLDDIMRDITTSIDTLCDLSRSQQGLRQPPIPPKSSFARAEPEKYRTHIDEDPKPGCPPARAPGPDPSPVLSNYIDFHLLRIPRDMAAGPSPPSYETVAASSDDRISAFLRDGYSELPVVLEYAPTLDSSSSTDSLTRRGKEMLETLRAPPQTPDNRGIYVGAMELLGWFQDPHQSRYGLVYRTPEHAANEKSHDHPSSHMSQTQQSANLLCFLQHSGNTETLNMPSLEDRFRLAYNLASSLYHFHAQGITHRSLNSNNIIFFFSGTPSGHAKDPEPWKEGAIRKPFLASFDQSDEDAHDDQEEPFISSIYRHPHTKRGQRSTYKPAYDLYSLGIILIEIGLWMPISRLWKTRYSRSDFKVRLQSVYIKKLVAKCGTSYMRVVEKCLRAADESSRDRTRSARPRIDIYWDLVKPLERCCMIDSEDDTLHALDDGLTEARKLSDRQSSANEQQHLLTSKPSAEIIASNKNELLERPAEPETVAMDSTESLGNHSEEMDVSPHGKPDIKASKTPCKCKVWSHELPMACSAYWNSIMCPKLDRMLQKVIDRWESYSIDLFMSGETPEAARPTIYMMCASTEKARKALQYLNRDKNLFEIKVVKGQITRSKAGKRRRPAKKGKQPAQPYQKGLSYRRYQQRPVCGASIGAYLDKHHLPPVSFGGTVLVDGEPYGMSVHHMLENEEVDMGLDHIVDINRSMAPRIEATEGDDSPSVHSIGPQSLPEALYPFEIEDDDDEGYQSESDPDTWLSELLESDDFGAHEGYDEEVDMGDTDGIDPGDGESLIVTQPAIDDVEEGFFPNEDDMDDDHLSSHSLGHIHASSGIKRSRRGAISHEVDWALIKMTSNRMQTRNVIAGGGQHGAAKPAVPSANSGNKSSYPSEVVKSEELGGLEVHAIGRTSGLQAGRILPVMSMIKLPGRISSSQSWTVMGNFGGKFFAYSLTLNRTDMSSHSWWRLRRLGSRQRHQSRLRPCPRFLRTQ